MVLTGEIALERLQRAAKARVSAAGARFENHYDLASFLLEFGKSRLAFADSDPVVGDVETLFRLLQGLNISTPDALHPYVQGLTAEGEKRPLAQQIVDQILASHPERYVAYATIRSDSPNLDPTVSIDPRNAGSIDPRHGALGYFIMQWVTFERFVWEFSKISGREQRAILTPNGKRLKSLDVFSAEELQQIERIRILRNELVHGLRHRSPVSLHSEGEALSKIFTRLRAHDDQAVREAIERAMIDLANVERIYDSTLTVHSKYSRFELSRDAIELIRAAAADEHGQILRLAFIGGRVIQAGSKQFGQENAREASRWEAALNELLAQRLVEVVGYQGEAFSLTHAGWLFSEKHQLEK